MKTVIVYYSKHHENTKKIVDCIAEAGNIELIDAASGKAADLTGFDIIGFASGIYYSKFHKTILEFAEKNLPENKKVFFIYTCGSKKESYINTIEEIAVRKNAEVLGAFGCLGYDTFGPFKLVGGIAKGHPDEADMEEAKQFYKKIANS